MNNMSKTIKNKLDKIKNSTIDANITENNDTVVINITVSCCTEPCMRHRDRRFGKGKYNPLGSYYTYFLNEVKKLITVESPYEGEFTMEINWFCKPESKMTEYQKLMGYAHEIRPMNKPDTDNIAKTIKDIFNGYLYKDDSQINTEIVNKYYHTEERTYITFTYYKDTNTLRNNTKGKRLNKQIKKEYEDKIKDIMEAFNL